MLKQFYALFILMVFAGFASAQQNKLEKQVTAFAKTHLSDPLFLHVDKSVYAATETIWFAAYQISNSSAPAQQPKTLNVLLIDETDKHIALSQKFWMENGLSSGSITLPDTVPPGRYQLSAYTDLIDRQGEPIARFTANILIRDMVRRDVKSTVSLLDSIPVNDQVRVKIELEMRNPKTGVQPTYSYSIGTSPVFKQKIGNNHFITIPAKAISRYGTAARIAIHYNGKSQFVNLQLPSVVKDRLMVRLFPEGGDLSNALTSTVAVEAKTEHNVPVAVQGIIYQNNTPVDTIRTTESGITTFKIRPSKENKYSLKLSAGKYLSQDTAIAFPNITDKDVVLHMANSVVNDTAILKLRTHLTRKIQILLDNHQGAYMLFSALVRPDAPPLKIPLDKAVKGLLTLTVLDEAGRPLAERLFFAHYKDSIRTAVRTDKPRYQKRDSVTINIHLTGRDGKPVAGLFSVAAVEEDRLLSNYPSIEDHVFLKNYIPDLTENQLENGLHDKSRLEEILLVKGWRRYTWQDLAGTASDTVSSFNHSQITGWVKKSGRPVTSPVGIAVLNGRQVSLIPTEPDGHFVLAREVMRSGANKIILMISGKDNNDYSIDIKDPFKQMDRQIVDCMHLPPATTLPRQVSNADSEKGIGRIINLETVVIKGRASGAYGGSFKGEPGINDCGDYVDEFGYLNYENSVNKYKPEMGKPYKKRTDSPNDRAVFKVEPVIYHGCPIEDKHNVIKIDGIYAAKEFYGFDEQLTEQQYLSTVYWKSGVVTDKSGEARLKFKAGDISGPFRIVVQGLTSDNVFYGSGSFSVQ